MADDQDTVHHGDLAIDEIRADPIGRDRRHLDEESVTFENRGTAPLDLSGWTVRNEAGDTFRFPDGRELAAGERVTLHTGSGTDAESDLYWGADRPLWRNAGDTIRVRDADGVLRIRESYRE